MNRLRYPLLLVVVVVLAGCSGSGAPPMDGGLGPDGSVACDPSADGDMVCATADPSKPVCVDGTCVECRSASNCGNGTPICVDNACTGCGEPGASEACMEADATKPACSVTGSCVECTDHDQCVSEVCERDANTCVSEEQIVYVANGGFLGEDEIGEDTPGCGIPQSKCLTIGYAVENRLDEEMGRVWVKIADGQYSGSLTFVNETARLIGDADVRLSGSEGRVVDIAEGVDLLIDRVLMNAHGADSYGIQCIGKERIPSQVLLQRSSVSNASFSGIFLADFCTLTLLDSIVDGNDQGGILRRSSYLVNTGGIVVRRSVIQNNGQVGIDTEHGSIEVERTVIADNKGGGIVVDEADFIIRNNFIQDNGDTSPAEVYTIGGVLIERDGPNQRIFEFNTVVGNTASDSIPRAPGIVCATIAPIEIKSSIAWGNEGGNRDALDPDGQISGFCDVSHSNVQGGLTQEYQLIIGPGNIDTDPLFVDPFRGDYRIQPESRAKDAADPEATLDIDFDGNPRPVGDGHDMGAHEVQ